MDEEEARVKLEEQDLLAAKLSEGQKKVKDMVNVGVRVSGRVRVRVSVMLEKQGLLTA